MPGFSFTFDGQQVVAMPGDSIAAALAANGYHQLGHRRRGQARGPFCGMGVCQDCLVTVDGRRGQRACLVPVTEAMCVVSEGDQANAPCPVTPAHPDELKLTAEIVIVGAGPAGLSAAVCAARSGAKVLVLDEREDTGGQYFKPRSSGYRGHHVEDRQHRKGAELRAAAQAAGVQVMGGQMVWFARRVESGFHLRSVSAQNQSLQVRALAMIIATGAYERPVVVPGWTLPGVMTIGAAQTYARRYGIAPAGRTLIAGHGPLGLQLAAEIHALGGVITALAERGAPRVGMAAIRAATASPRLMASGVAYWLSVKRHRTSILWGWELSEILGESAAEAAVLTQIHTGKTRFLDVDNVIAGEGFTPQLELARLLGVAVAADQDSGNVTPECAADGSTAVVGLWIAGDAGGLGGAEVAAIQGDLCAQSALSYLGKTHSSQRQTTHCKLQRAMRFQSALWQLYQAPQRALPPVDAVLCRCEDVSVATARTAIDKGACDPSTLKRETRVGMGRCQGRYCLPQVLRLLKDAGHDIPAEALHAPQIPARPVPIAALAREQAEWGGHRSSAPSVRPNRCTAEPISVNAADLVIIGSGVTGISAALYAARAGASVVCLDRGRVNGEASGGNAGSLHLQLLSWDFGGKAVGDGSLQLRTLPLQEESIHLWKTLEQELSADFDMAVTGGLMVAESSVQLRFLEDKVRAEAQVGIQSEVIDTSAVRAIIPAISANVAGAAWCPGEGKINPLVATPALANAARDSGAVIEEFAGVTGIVRNAAGYLIRTQRGDIQAARILIAAGGWSTQIAQLLGVELPVRGAPLQMIVTAQAPLLVPCLLAHAGRHLTMKQADAGSVIIGGAWPAATASNGYAEVLPDSLDGNLWVASKTVPAVGSLQMIRSWAAMNIDIDGAPLISSVPGLDGVSVAATANGYTLGPLLGREAASLALHGRARQDLEAFSMSRFND